MAGWDLPTLTSLQLQNSPAVDDAGVAAVAGLTALRRWGVEHCYMGGRAVPNQGAAILALALFPGLLKQSTPGCMHATLRSEAPTYNHGPLLCTVRAQAGNKVTHHGPLSSRRSLNLKQCKRVGDAGLAAIAPKLQQLTSLCLQVSACRGCGCPGASFEAPGSVHGVRWGRATARPCLPPGRVLGATPNRRRPPCPAA